MADATTLLGQGFADGEAGGPVLHLTEPLNAWGGLDPRTGLLIHRQHPQRGANVAGTVLVLLETRGSGTNAQVLAETWRNRLGPAAVVLGRPDSVLMAGVIVARDLYGIKCPVAVLDPESLARFRDVATAHVLVRGTTATITLSPE